jgi:hypothetical protein
MKKVLLKTLKRGDLFKRKPEANAIYIREHYNRKDQFGPASFCCVDWCDIGRDIQLKPTTPVFIDFDF